MNQKPLNISLKLTSLKKLLRVGGAVFLVGLLAKVVGFIKELIVAKEIGVSEELDGFIIGLMLVSIFINLLIESLGQSFIPTYVRLKLYDKNRAESLFNSLLNWGLIGTMVIAGVLFLLARPLAEFFSRNGANPELIHDYLIALLPFFLLTYVAVMLGGYLNANGKNLPRACYPGFPSLFTIIFFLGVSLEAKIYNQIWGFNAGLLAAVIIFYFYSASIGYRYSFRFKTNLTTRIVFFQWLPLILGMSLIAINAIVDKTMATSLVVGNVSKLDYGFKVYGIFSSLSISTLTILFLPYFSKEVGNRNFRKIQKILHLGILAILLVAGVITLFITFFSEELVRLLFERGEFNSEDTVEVAKVMKFYTFGLAFQLTGLLMVRLISSLNQNRLITWGALISLVCNVIFNIIFIKPFGVSGLALATSVTYFILFFWLFAVVRKSLLQKMNSET